MYLLRYALLSFVLLAICTPASVAEPILKSIAQTVSNRVTPLPFTIDDYHGTLQWGYDKVRFLAPGGVIEWKPWTDPDYLAAARQAMAIVEQRAVGNPQCNAFFARRMPGGKTFDEIWHATGPERIRISFSPGPSGTWRAATYGNTAPYEWTITENTVKLGPESIASAMLHEATRTNGIGNGNGNDQIIAYRAERVCGMQQYILNLTFIKKLGWKINRP